MNNIPAGRLVIGKFHGQVPGLLFHPGRIRIGRTAGDMNAASAQVNEKQHVERNQASCCPDFLGKKVSGPGNVQVRLNEGCPGQAFALR